MLNSFILQIDKRELGFFVFRSTSFQNTVRRQNNIKGSVSQTKAVASRSKSCLSEHLFDRFTLSLVTETYQDLEWRWNTIRSIIASNFVLLTTLHGVIVDIYLFCGKMKAFPKCKILRTFLV